MSKIEWTDETWNPVVGCTPVSPGCLNCYAAAMAPRLAAMGQQQYVGLTVERKGAEGQRGKGTKGRSVFNGVVRMLPERLTEPLGWKKPRMVFVDSMSDLFHQDVPFEFIDKVFAVMALTPRHTYQVLTKRPERMAEYLALPWAEDGDRWLRAVGSLPESVLDMPMEDIRFALPNVWLGTSVEDQARADERIPHLLKCPAAVRFLSVEPMIGAVDLARHMHHLPCPDHPGEGTKMASFGCMGCSDRIQWVIVGGESGPGARPCNVEWIESIVTQCKDARVPVFVKQLGARAFGGTDPVCSFGSYQEWVNKAGSWLGGKSSTGRRHSPRFTGACADSRGRLCEVGKDFMRARDDGSFPVTAHEFLKLADRKGGDPDEWPERLRVREWPKVAAV